MKTLFIEAKSIVDIKEVMKKVKIKGKVGLISSIQYVDYLKEAQKYLKASIILGPILGCNLGKAEELSKHVDSFLFIGSGDFHPLLPLMKTKKEVYIANPETNNFTELDPSLADKYEKELKGKTLRYYNAKKIGIIVSTKPFQHNLKIAYDLKQNTKKQAFIFICDSIDLNELENFPDIDIWINTACPRIEGKNLINIEDVMNLPEL